MPSSKGHLTSLFAKEADTPSKEIEPLARASWYAVEAFGNIFGAADVEQSRYISLDQPPDSLQETLQRIKGDNHRYYFLSGEVDRLIYDEKCTFCDPFVSFDGRDRFIKNLANLGSFIARYDVKPLGYQVQNPTLVKTKVCVLEENFRAMLLHPSFLPFEKNGKNVCFSIHYVSHSISCFFLGQALVKLELKLPWKPILAWPWG